MTRQTRERACSRALQDLATLTYNITHTALNPKAKIILTTRPTPLQEKAFKLLGVSAPRTQ